MGWFSDFFSDPIGTIGKVGQSIIDVTVDAISDVVSWFVEIPEFDDQENAAAQYEGVLVNKQSNIASLPVIYGQRKVGGTRIFIGSSGTDNIYLYMVLAICEAKYIPLVMCI